MNTTIKILKENVSLNSVLDTENFIRESNAFEEGHECKHYNQFQFFAHGCNLDDEWGGGIAAYYFNKEQGMYDSSVRAKFKKLGGFTKADSNLSNAVGYNLYTQTHGGSGSFSYLALYQSVYSMMCDIFITIQNLSDRCLDNYVDIALPMIGSGIAGGNPNACLFYMCLAIQDSIENSLKSLNYTNADFNIFFVIWDDVYLKMSPLSKQFIDMLQQPRGAFTSVDYPSWLSEFSDPRSTKFSEEGVLKLISCFPKNMVSFTI